MLSVTYWGSQGAGPVRIWDAEKIMSPKNIIKPYFVALRSPLTKLRPKEVSE